MQHDILERQAHTTVRLPLAKRAETDQKQIVTVIGLGYVGLPLALMAETEGYRVFGIDTDIEKVEALKRKSAPHLSEQEKKLFQKSKFHIRTDGSPLADSDIVLVCVPTPVYADHAPNLEPLIGATELVAANLSEGQLVIIESTVNPGVCEEVLIPILERVSGLAAGKDFFFAHCPERINPGDDRWTLATINRVIGANDATSLARASIFYESILDADVYPMQSLKEAEAVKIVENSFRDINIAFVNELAMSFDKLGIDVTNVIKGASTKPFSFMAHFPGCGVGGHCIPVDPYYLISYAAENGFTHRFLSAAREINNGMPHYTVNLMAGILADAYTESKASLDGKQIALLGLSYKRDVPDLRESPALEIKEELERQGATVRVFDPFLPTQSTAKTLEEAITGADGIILATDHSAFTALTPALCRKAGVSAIVDGRNFLPKDRFVAAGISYKGIGR